MRTEIARLEIKHQEELLNNKPMLKVESKEMKYIMTSHRNEIEELKGQIHKLKQALYDRDVEISRLKDDRQVSQFFAFSCLANRVYRGRCAV